MGSSHEKVATLVDRFFSLRGEGRRVSIDELVADDAELEDRAATRVDVLHGIIKRRRGGESDSSSGLKPQTSSPEDAYPSIDGYDLIDEIGRGGMGKVYEAYQQSTGRRVAIKFMLESSDPGPAARHRFEREVELIARLQHPSIVSIIDSGIHRGRYFYVMEYFDGLPLDQAVPPGTLPAREVLPLIAALCDAVDYAHQRGVLHRDLKPGNILIVDEGAKGSRGLGAKGQEESRSAPRPLGPLTPQPKLLDFGLAKALDAGAPLEASLSRPGQIIGTLGYMPPEQARGRIAETSVRSDVYALGAIAYELITGSLPCPIDGPLSEVLRRIEQQDPRPPSQLLGRRDRDLDAMLLKALEKSPALRYSTAGEFAADIRRYLELRPIAARPVGPLVRSLRWFRRHRAISLTTALSLIAITLIGGVAVKRVLREQEKRGWIAEFWMELTRAMDLGKQRGEDVPMVHVYDQAERRVSMLFATDPETEADMRYWLGANYQALSEFGRADQQFLRVYWLRRNLHGPDHPAVAEAARQQGFALKSQSRYAEAEPHYVEAIRIHRALGDEAGVSSDLSYLAKLQADQGRHDEADASYREAIAIRKRISSDPLNDPDLMQLNRGLGIRLLYMGHYSEAEPILRESYAIAMRAWSQNHPLERSMAATALATALCRLGRLEEAESLAREGLQPRETAFWRSKHPEGHLLHLESDELLGEILVGRGMTADAEVILRRALGPCEGKFKEMVLAGMVRSVLGECLVKQGRLAEAEPLLLAGLDHIKKKLGNDDPETQRANQRLLALYEAWGNADRAAEVRATLAPASAQRSRP